MTMSLMQKGTAKLGKSSNAFSGKMPKMAKMPALKMAFPKSTHAGAMAGTSNAKATKLFGNIIKNNAPKAMSAAPKMAMRGGKY